ncbi:LLM class flavin-dependent oxidoreductase [Nocardia brasiliensis]|uniref:LLM class flavin-dependent oxidoreductase n=1 Tax=Nocardia brasiliensis TaxID=37326 RepID=UPI003D8A4BC9
MADRQKAAEMQFGDESFAALTYLAALTRTIRVGTSVAVLPLRHPLHTARAIATIDQLSGGRVVFGIGVGGAELEYRSLGVDFRRRGAIADERHSANGSAQD